MAKPDNIPTLAQLARQYGTISDSQYKHLVRLHALKKKENNAQDFSQLLLSQKLATRYQLALLQRIQEYYLIRRQGEIFGKIAVEKGFATRQDIQKALDIQKREFKKARLKKLVGDILVERRVITAEQKRQIVKEQTFVDKLGASARPDARAPSASPSPRRRGEELELSEYEKEFLRIKALDEEFSASVIEKGLAGESEINRAKDIQKSAFENENAIKILGDIMVSLSLITPEQNSIILAEQGRDKGLAAPDSDKPVIDIRISDDKMAAWVNIAESHLNTATIENIRSEIKKQGIVSGIYPDGMIQAHLDQKIGNFPIARQDHSQVLRKDRELESRLDEDLTGKGEKRKGDTLVQQRAAWNNTPRENIFGRLSTSASSHDFTLRCGSGTRLSRDKTGIVAAKTGIPAVSVERFVYVHPIINVLEDADQRYGKLEAYANLSVSGAITGAYPVTAGHVRAREIRGADIDAVGDIRASVGITDTVIRCQGDVHARYLHNCVIESFGTVYVKNEIFDSVVKCSGRLNSPGCRIISSRIYAKKGVTLAGAGSERTPACTIIAGTDHHVLALETDIQRQKQRITRRLADLKREHTAAVTAAKTVFQKMIELKMFHDRSRQKKERLAQELSQKKEGYSKNRLRQLAKMIADFQNRMQTSVNQLKQLNRQKKRHDQEVLRLASQIKAVTRKTNKEILSLDRTLFAYLEWARDETSSPEIEIRGKAFQGTVMGGAFTRVILENDHAPCSASEAASSSGAPVMKIR